MDNSVLHIGDWYSIMFVSRWVEILYSTGLQKLEIGFPGFIKDLANLLGSLGRKTPIPDVILVGFFLIVPIRVFGQSKVSIVVPLIVSYVPELICCMVHISENICFFISQYYCCFF